jgi:GNAT superfamily N-acetyltransferase
MNIRKFEHGDAVPCAKLIYNVFEKYNGDDYFFKSGITDVLDSLDVNKLSPEDVLMIFKNSRIVYVVTVKEKIVGVIRGSENKITSLMVDGKFQKQGIGKKLLSRFERKAKNLGSEYIKIKSSLFAVGFYQGLGFKKTTGIRNFQGLKIFNMKKAL